MSTTTDLKEAIELVKKDDFMKKFNQDNREKSAKDKVAAVRSARRVEASSSCGSGSGEPEPPNRRCSCPGGKEGP